MSIKRSNADAAFSEAIRLNKNHTCEHCGRQGRTECAHIVGRREKTLRWCADNALSLCHSCHRHFTENPLDFTDWLREHIGEGMLEILQEKRRGILKDNKSTRDEVARHCRVSATRLRAQHNVHELQRVGVGCAPRRLLHQPHSL